jgi:hypothetical protein
MKFRFIFLIMVAFAVGSTSYSTGLSGGAVGGCSCHGANSAATSIIVSGLPSGAVSYIPGSTYAVSVSVSNAIMNAAGITASVGAGNFANLGANLQYGSGTQEIMHTAAKSFGGSTFTTFQFDWVAPATAGLLIDFQVSANAVNLDGGTSGDEWNSGVFFLPLELEFSSFQVQPAANQVKLVWNTIREKDIQKFVIERSADGVQFDSIGVVIANGDPQTGREYLFIDKPKHTSFYYYRFSVGHKTTNNVTYGPTKVIKFDNGANFDFIAFPNPVAKDGKLNLNLFNCKAGISSVEILDMRGDTIYKNIYNTQNGTNYLDLTAKLSPGNYTILVTDGTQKRLIRKVVAQ